MRVRGGSAALRRRDQGLPIRAHAPEISMCPGFSDNSPHSTTHAQLSRPTLSAAIALFVRSIPSRGTGGFVHVVHMTPLRSLGRSHNLVCETEEDWTNRTS